MVYIIKRDNEYKVGYSKHPEKRLKQLQTGNGQRLELLKVYNGGKELERKIQDKLRSHIIGKQSNLVGEWFKISDKWLNVILFEIDRKLVNYDQSTIAENYNWLDTIGNKGE